MEEVGVLLIVAEAKLKNLTDSNFKSMDEAGV